MMYKSLLTLMLLSGICVAVHSQKIAASEKFAAASIPDSLKTDAEAVFRLDEGIVEIQSPSSYTFKVHQIVTLLSKKADYLLRQSLGFDKLNKVEDVRISMYNNLGVKTVDYKKSDFETRNVYDDMSIFTDDKYMTLQLMAPSYPCTIDVSYETKCSGYLGYPSWIIANPSRSVEHSVYSVSMPAEMDIRYKTYNTNIKAAITTEGKVKKYVWEAFNIKAPAEPEEGSYENSMDYGTIRVSPNTFSYDGYAGNMQTWKDFGNWNYPLYTDAKSFDKDQTWMIQNMVSACKNDKEKITVLYDYLKRSMRYVSVQLGIGGFKPFPIQYVNEKKYGDCKALTNYMRYLLKTAGINAYPALVNAGSKSPPIDKSFPSANFNHVILCVPLATDSVWLECTSNNNEAGNLGSFTENKIALLLTENGGKLVNTPVSKSTDNIIHTNTVIKLNEAGGSAVKSSIRCKGDFWDIFYSINQMNSNDQKSVITRYLGYKAADEFKLDQQPKVDGVGCFNIELNFDQAYDFKTASKYFFAQKIHESCLEKIENKERRSPYVFRFPYEKRDTTTYILDPSLTVDQLPENRELKNEFVTFTSQSVKNDNSITIITHFEIKKKVVPAEAYKELAEAIAQVHKFEAQKFVLKKT